MASSFTSVYQYGRPEQLDISNLVKATTYKQDTYNQNTTEMQQLVNQYAGTDLLRDVDKNYLGNRLSTLVDYVNNTGTLDWGNKNVFNEVSNYVSKAIDSNVISAVSSTQQFRKHQANMEDLKKNKPDQYSAQNDWMASRDINRYLESDKVGDTYKQGSYVPYTDTNKLIMDNLKVLEKHGIQTTFTSDGNPLLTRIDKHEVLTENEANQYLGLILGAKGTQQLAIDGMYNYRGENLETLASTYENMLENNAKSLDSLAKTAEVLKVGKTADEKKKMDSFIANYSEQANAIRADKKKGMTMDKDQLAATIHTNSYKSNWSKMLAFDNVVDWKIDDRNFNIAKRNDDLLHKEWERDFQQNKFTVDQFWKQKDYDLEVMKAMSKGEVTMDADGNPIMGSGVAAGYGNANGIVETSNPTELGEASIMTAEDIQKNYSRDFVDAKNEVSKEIAKLKTTESGRNKLKSVYGNLAEGDSEKLVYEMMRGGKESQIKFNRISEMMGEGARNAVQKSIVSYRQVRKMDAHFDNMEKGLGDLAEKVMMSDNKSFYGLDQQVIGKDGKVTQGSYIGKDFNKLTQQERLGAKIGVISNLMMGDTEPAERSALVVLQKKLISQIVDKDARKAFEKYGETQNMSLLESAQHAGSAIWNATKRDWNSLQLLSGFGDSTDVRERDEAAKTAEYNQRMNRTYGNKINSHVKDFFTTNYKFDDLASNDLTDRNGKPIVLGQTPDGKYNIDGREFYNQKVGNHFKLLNEQLQADNTIKLSNKTLNVDTETKIGKTLLPSIKPFLGSDIQKDANVQINVNTDEGTVTFTAPVKEGKEYQMTTSAPIPFSDVPPALLSQLKKGDNRDYDASSGNPSAFYTQGQVYKNDNEIQSLYGDSIINPKEGRTTVKELTEMSRTLIGEKNFTEHKDEIIKLIATPVDFEAKVVNGVYVMSHKAGETILGTNRVLGTDISEQKDIINSNRDKIATEQILNYIKNNYNK